MQNAAPPIVNPPLQNVALGGSIPTWNSAVLRNAAGYVIPQVTPPAQQMARANSESDNQITQHYPLIEQEADRTNLKQGQLVFVNKETLQRKDQNLHNYNIKNLADLNRELRRGYSEAMLIIKNILNPQNSSSDKRTAANAERKEALERLLSTPETLWYNHSIFKNVTSANDPILKIKRYMTLESIMDEWRFLGTFLVDDNMHKKEGGVLQWNNMLITVLLAGDEKMEDVWGVKAKKNSKLHFIVKRIYDVNQKKYGPFQFVPYANFSDLYGIVPSEERQYQDFSKTTQYGDVITIGMVTHIRHGHTSEDARLIESGLKLGQGGNSVTENYKNVKHFRAVLYKHNTAKVNRITTI